MAIHHAVTHGQSNTKEYYAWQKLKERCLNTKAKNYKDYGGRGITVCDRWKDSFENFIEDMGLSPSKKHSIDRKNNELGYYKENCRWADSTTQNRNTRTNFYVTFNGKTKLLIEFCEELNISYNMVYKRIKERNWTVEEALTNIKIINKKSKIKSKNFVKSINFNTNDTSS